MITAAPSSAAYRHRFGSLVDDVVRALGGVGVERDPLRRVLRGLLSELGAPSLTLEALDRLLAETPRKLGA